VLAGNLPTVIASPGAFSRLAQGSAGLGVDSDGSTVVGFRGNPRNARETGAGRYRQGRQPMWRNV